MKYKIQVQSIWEYGQRVDSEGNPHQEDNMFPAHGMATSEDRLFILCDGMGGHDAGEVASATVCEAMSRSILSSKGPFSDSVLQKALDDAFLALDAVGGATESAKKMGTTMTLLALHESDATIAHMGDSRVYHIRPGKTAEETRILFRTEDHSLVNELVRLGELTPEEARHSRQKNVITRAMQPHNEKNPKADVYHATDIQPGDFFYLCTDGMLENMEDRQLCFFFSRQVNEEERPDLLRQATQENRDNHSAIIVNVVSVTGKAKAKRSANKTRWHMGCIIGVLLVLWASVSWHLFGAKLMGLEMRNDSIIDTISNIMDTNDESVDSNV